MTLIEILIVMAIAAMLAGGATMGFSALPRTRLRVGALKLAGVFHLAYVHALTTGRTTRVAFQLGGNRFQVEDTDDAHSLDPHDPLHAGGSADVQLSAIEAAKLLADPRPRAPRASFRPVSRRMFDNDANGHFETGIVFEKLYSQHDPEPREEGAGSVYFFPGGVAERAVVQLRNPNGEIFSVTLNPLTAHTEVMDRPVEPASSEDNDRTDQVEIDARTNAPARSP